MTTRYRITVRANDIELRGHIDGRERLDQVAQALQASGVMVIASVSEDQSDGPIPASWTQIGNDLFEVGMSDGTKRYANGRGELLERTDS